MPERTRIDRLRMTAPEGTDANRLARDAAAALRRELDRSERTGRVDRVHVTLSAEEAADPRAIARAVARALVGGGS